MSMFGETPNENIGIPRSVVIECGDCTAKQYVQIPVGVMTQQYLADINCQCGSENVKPSQTGLSVALGPDSDTEK